MWRTERLIMNYIVIIVL